MGKENILTQKEKAIVKEAVKAYRDTILDEEKNVDKILSKNIRKMLTNYRRTKAKLADEAVLTKEEERELGSCVMKKKDVWNCLRLSS